MDTQTRRDNIVISHQNQVSSFRTGDSTMTQNVETTQDIMFHYIANVRHLQHKLLNVQKKQQDNLTALLLLKDRCQAIRQALTP